MTILAINLCLLLCEVVPLKHDDLSHQPLPPPLPLGDLLLPIILEVYLVRTNLELVTCGVLALVDEEGGEAKNSLLLHNGTLLLQANHLQLLLQLGYVELGDGESFFRIHDVLPLKICCHSGSLL